MLRFWRLHNFLKVAFISNSCCSSGEQSQITAIKTEIVLILFIPNHKSTYYMHITYIYCKVWVFLIPHLFEKSKSSDKKL